MQSTLNKNRVYHANRKGKHGGSGFNCWGATLFVLGHADTLLWQNCTYMTRWLEDETVEIEEATKPGDIIAVWSYCLEHTAVYIGHGRYFHKRGSNEAEILTLEGVKDIYPGEYTFRRLIGAE